MQFLIGTTAWYLDVPLHLQILTVVPSPYSINLLFGFTTKDVDTNLNERFFHDSMISCSQNITLSTLPLESFRGLVANRGSLYGVYIYLHLSHKNQPLMWVNITVPSMLWAAVFRDFCWLNSPPIHQTQLLGGGVSHYTLLPGETHAILPWWFGRGSCWPAKSHL